MDKRFCDICGEEIKDRVPYAGIYGYKRGWLSWGASLDICSKGCLKKFVENGFKPPKKVKR